MAIDERAFIAEVPRGNALDTGGIHGLAHRAGVLEKGFRVAGETGTDGEVVSLFALLHDSRRLSDGGDPEHGPRAAEFARTFRGRAFPLPACHFEQLHAACEGHTHPSSKSLPRGRAWGNP